MLPSFVRRSMRREALFLILSFFLLKGVSFSLWIQWWSQLLKRVACENMWWLTHTFSLVWLKAWPVIGSQRTSGSDTSTWSNENWNVWWLSPANMPLPSLKVIEFWSIRLSLFGSVILSVSFKELSVPPGVRSHQHDGHSRRAWANAFIRCLNRQRYAWVSNENMLSYFPLNVLSRLTYFFFLYWSKSHRLISLLSGKLFLDCYLKVLVY